VREPSTVYAMLLGERIRRHGTRVYLVSTGWTGGPYGEGKRIRIAHTRAMVRAAIAGQLEEMPVARDPVFGVEIFQACPGGSRRRAQAKDTWRNPSAYDAQARKLEAMFIESFKAFREGVSPEARCEPRASG
jgi:phosphoenolpyruvate carboxykinase (ATP)